VVLAAGVCSAQNITSAHSGTVHYFEGDVSIDGATIQAKVGRFSEIKEQSVLRTGKGRAEVLLTPGVFLRVGENSAIRMLDNRLLSTRVELMDGNVAIEADNEQMTTKDSPVTLLYKDYSIRMVKAGLVEVGTEPALLKVFKGTADVTTADSRATVKEGRQMPFSAALLTEKFDDKIGDDLYLWSRDRSQSLSAASMASARYLNTPGAVSAGYVPSYGYSSLGNWNSGWFFNPYLGTYTFVPGGGNIFLNAFGYGFFSPSSVYYFYTPTNYWYGGGGARGTTIGRPVFASSGINATTAAPLSTLRGAGISSAPALGSPVRGGGVVGASSGMPNRGPDFGSMVNSADSGFGGGSAIGGGMRSGGGAAPAMSAPAAAGGGARSSAMGSRGR
jgi:hypothetical protein